MQKGLLLCCVAACLLTAPALGQAQDQTAPPAGKHVVTPAGPEAASGPQRPAPHPKGGHGAVEDSRTKAAEARYHDWVTREHARDAEAFAQDKAKIENKYKGYVRPKHPKKDAATHRPVPPKGQ